MFQLMLHILCISRTAGYIGAKLNNTRREDTQPQFASLTNGKGTRSPEIAGLA